MMQVLSVNVSIAKRLRHGDREIETGIDKQAVTGPVSVATGGLAGDVQVDRKHHGGIDKAVYVYTEENRRYWAEQRNEAVSPPGRFGENLTVTGMPDGNVHIGDVFAIGSTVLQVTQPRVPCHKLGIQFGEPEFVGAFLVSGRAGFYLRVLEEGIVEAGDMIRLVRPDPASVSIRDAMQALIKGPHQVEWMRRALTVAALSDAWRQDLTRRLASACIPPRQEYP